MAKMQAVRYHDISCGHRVVGHEGKCRHLHGHNYRIHFYCEADTLDDVGRVIDFSVIKEKLCMWLENNWDHKFLAWQNDSMMSAIHYSVNNDDDQSQEDRQHFNESLVWVTFNPTAENIANYLLETVGPEELHGTGVTLVKVVVEETAKCSVDCSI
jgi:6-pyruvoyltetrahydropterin/6-carboxytetrahydropterin synthase